MLPKGYKEARCDGSPLYPRIKRHSSSQSGLSNDTLSGGREGRTQTIKLLESGSDRSI